MSLNSLNHSKVSLPNGGMVLVLDTGAVINPESEAMIQALHSRSVGGVQHHLEVLEKRGAENFMSNFYVGYGHKSIGDCGSITIFIEGVSMLAAKAVQDWALYSGQEASTRYIDFKQQPFINPLGTEEGNEILERWRTFYIESMDPLVASLSEKFPMSEGEKESVYKKAINARAFDILRGFLPAGASTNLAWHSNLRQVADKMALLRHHPLLEVRDIADGLQEALIQAYPSSFNHKKYKNTENYSEDWMKNDYYFRHDAYKEVELLFDGIDHELLQSEYGKALKNRPAHTELPKHIGDTGTIQFGFMLDYGSFRDIQRHRAVRQRMPLVTDAHGFEEWYLNELTDGLRNKAKEVVDSQGQAIANLNATDEEKQYYHAMGNKLPNRISGDLPSLVYLAELRATRFVHPTLRKRARQMADLLEQMYGKYGLVMHLDTEPDRFDAKRGEQDIVFKD